jgi:putative endonuclease
MIYVGMTAGLLERVESHRNHLQPGSYTAQHNIDMLVYFETYQYIDQAIRRETCLKRWKRPWKIELIESVNHEWKDFYKQLLSGEYRERYSSLRDREFSKEEIAQKKNGVPASAGMTIKKEGDEKMGITIGITKEERKRGK